MKVLIVDSEKMIRTGITNAIPWQSLGIREVYTAGSTNTAILLLRQYHPDIMIVEMDMSYNSITLIEQARKMNASIRIIALTSHARLDFVRECQRLNIQDFLRKPIDEKMLTEMIRKQVLGMKVEKNEMNEYVMNKQQKMQAFQEVFETVRKTICASIGDEENINKQIRILSQAAAKYDISDDTFRNSCSELVFVVYQEQFREVSGEYLEKFHQSLLAKNRKGIEELTRSLLLDRKENSNSDESHDSIRFAKQYIVEHLQEDLSVADIAGLLFLTPNYFSRLFKKITGMGCNEFIVTERINKAKALLEATNLKTNRIAGMVGYKDTNYFSLAFKKKVGVSPRSYREQFRKEINN